MAIWIKTVDPAWFDFVSSKPQLEEVNLWHPKSLGLFKGAETGDLVLFHVKGRRGLIAGYGTFFNAAVYYAEDAWDMFGEQNGAGTYELFVEQIERRRKSRHANGYAVACHDIVQPIYFDSLRAPMPGEAPRRLGSGPIAEDSDDGKLLHSLMRHAESSTRQAPVHGFGDMLASDRPIRLGRSGFRMGVTEAYGRTCAITGETVLPCLDAVHWVPHRYGGPMIVQNGSLFRRDFHPLVEHGFMTIGDDYRIVISVWLQRMHENSNYYLGFDGAPLHLPENRELWPDLELLGRHRRDIFYKGGGISRS